MSKIFIFLIVLFLWSSVDAEEVKIEQLKSWFSGNDFVKVSRAARILENEKYLNVLKKWKTENDPLLAKRSFVLIKRIVKNDDAFLRTKEYIDHIQKSYKLRQDEIYKYFDWLVKQQSPDGSWGEKSK